jgi:hypothetical protein
VTADVTSVHFARHTSAKGRALPFIAAAVLGLAACDLNVTVSGVVRDTSGAPLEDVAVTLQTAGREPDRTKTLGDGSFNVGIVGADPRQTQISFHKDGFQDLAKGLDGEARPTMEVTLLRN